MGAALLKSFLFGVVVAAAIGPIALLIFSTAAGRGFAAGAFAGAGAALADLLYALAAFSAGALLLPLLAAHERGIRIGGGLLLIALGIAMLLGGRPAEGTRATPRAAAALWPTFLLTLVNPLTIVVFAGFVPQLPLAGSAGNAAALALALFLGSLTVQLALAAAGAALGAALPSPGWRRALGAASALGVLGFGIAGLAGA